VLSGREVTIVPGSAAHPPVAMRDAIPWSVIFTRLGHQGKWVVLET